MKSHFVTFYSPGTFVSEETILPIEKWDIDIAVYMSKSIKERYGAKPYGFQFSTRERKKHELDSHVTKTSNMYYLGGEVFTLEQVKRRFPNDRILISNMEANGIDKIIVNTNSWKWTATLRKADIILNL